uniref:Uncharacterized protein n=1 Tax=Acrobeloides nanus TaxID=290746 RepID=A0A914EIH9_9BILA
MKILCFVLIIAIFVVSSYARFIFNSGFKLPWSHLVSNNLISNNRFKSDNSDPKFKEGVVNWLKDQIDPEIIKTYYGLSLNDRTCIQGSLMMVTDKLDEKRPEAAMEFIENLCPSASSASEKIYDGLHEIYKKMENWSETFLDDMPDSIRVAAEKVNIQDVRKFIPDFQKFAKNRV